MSDTRSPFSPHQELITIETAVQVIQEHLPPRKTIRVPLLSAVDMVLAEPIVAPEPSPRYTNSAMDGFAVRFVDVQNASLENPVALQRIGESQAGVPFQGNVLPGTAVAINTGAMMPEGADTVIPIEDVTVEQETVIVTRPPHQFQHVRYAGEEFQAGTQLLPAGTLVTPTQIALLASLGLVEVAVYQPLRVAILVTGSELVPPEAQPQPHQIRESNGIMLQAAIERSGGIPVFRTIVADDPQQTLKALQRAETVADVILFSGGVSMGPHDHVKWATVEAGFHPLFWRVKQKPGKPLFFALKGEQLLFGLPGNPVSAFMTYTFYVHPVLQYALGLPFGWNLQKVQLGEAIENTLKRAHFMRLTLEEKNGMWIARPLRKQGSHMLTTVAHAKGFVKLDVGESHAAGEMIDMYVFP